MIIWIFWLSALASTIKCEPPVNSYLPPSAGGAGRRPSSEYGPPGASNGRGNLPGSSVGGFGNQNQPQESYLPPGQDQFGQSPDSQYGPPSAQGRPFGQRGSGQSEKRQGFGAQPQGFGSRSQSGFGSQPQQGFGSQPRDQGPSSQYGPPGQGGPGSRQPGSQSSLGGSGGLQSIYGQPGRSQPGQRGQGSFGGPGENDDSNQVGIGRRPESSYDPPPTGSYQSPDGGFGSGSSSNQRGGQAQIPSSSYGVPDVGDEQSRFDTGTPNQQRAPGSSYGMPEVRNDQGGFNSRLKGGSAGQLPSASYGAPGFGEGSGRGGGGDGGQGQGSDFDGSESDEPAKYEFNYDVNDAQSGTKFGHTEQRDGATATGEYNVVLPDGRKQVVEYEAGLQGYKPMIRYEGSGSTGSEFGSGGSRSLGSSSQVGQGYTKDGPGGSGGFLGNSNDIGLPRGGLGGEGPDRYQEPEDFGQEVPPREGEGYPRGGPSGRKTPESPGGLRQREKGFPSSNLGDNGLESFGSDTGYPRGGPQRGRGFSDGDPQGGIFPGGSGQGPAESDSQSGGYTSNGPQEARGFPGSGFQDRDRVPPSGGPQNGRGLSKGGSQGDGRGFPGAGPQSGRGFSSGRTQGRFASGGSQGYPRGESQGSQDRGGLGSNNGYPRGGPQSGGRGLPGQTGGQGGSVGYASGGPGRQGGFAGNSQENDRFGGNIRGNDRFRGSAGPGFGAGSQGSMGYPRGVPQGGGRGLPSPAQGGDQGYPSGAPNGPRGSGY